MGTITVTNTNDSGPGSLRDAVAPSQNEPNEYFNGTNGVLTVAASTFSGSRGGQDELTEYFNGTNGVLTVAASTFSGADEGQDTLTEYFNGSNGVLTVAGQDILTGGDYSEVGSTSATINTGNGNDSFRSTSATIDTGNGDDFLSGGYSELRPIFEILLPLPPMPSFQFNGFPGFSLKISGNNSSRVFS